MATKRSAAANLADAAPVFAALGDPTRLRIVAQLSSQGPQSIVRLTETTDVSRQAITKHLYVLEEARLARSVRNGRESIWELQPERLADVQRYLDDISSQWDGALERLRALVEK
ncbi:MAG TPA: metalloregulator ArsR/SmtB family transcription factor [Gammaproteobacteria bacterium]|nr:metalloregulator ArsR/SmtB family transcription factor [Gammaproteobacteria bacterium]